MKPRVLFIGGTGRISTACVRLAVERGWAVTLLNRGRTHLRVPPPDGVEVVVADVRDLDAAQEALQGRTFDVVCEFLGFNADEVAADIELFRGRVGQYIYISSASAYHKPPTTWPITEASSLGNPYWQYSRDKIAAESVLQAAWRDEGFPVTIVRPSHTYDGTSCPLPGGWTAMQRIIEGRPIVIHGDGTSLWTLTHSRDFAKGFVGLFGRREAIGEAFHITTDEVHTWDQIAGSLYEAAYSLGAIASREPRIVHVASDMIADVIPDLGPGLVGDKANSLMFDNSRIKALVPDFVCTTSWDAGARETVEWYLAHTDQATADPGLDAGFQRLIEARTSL
ncbi:SDR family oxidoreductase [Brooklawnia cerclae]|uniref:Nucleoside-diphosphate-sugar epimerase n=1 Tax=Brooklawnia cerclae TaxID=349934 RepID=A0ABX0SHE1_9ACTN|nr:SDR family oxidoreductase [Brooklawnia cerclae]NIH56166.1 nucleoside-diphosphate-sugar epimerase [Brooklawnia cerclae]